MTTTEPTIDNIRERFAPAVDAIESKLRDGRRTFTRGQRAAEDAADVAVVRIRQRPFAAVFGAAAIGVAAGVSVGLIAGYAMRREPC